MVELIELLSFQNRETLAVALGLLLFIILFHLLSRRLDKGPSIIVAFAASLIASWQIYTNEFYGFEKTLAFLLYLALIGIAVKFVLLPFIRFFRKQF